MKHTISHKIYIVLALVAIASLVLASITGGTLAYLTDSDAVTNSFTFRVLGDNRTDRVNYYYLSKNGVATQIRDSGYINNTWTYRENERVYISESNSNIKAAPNGFKLSYAMVGGNRVNAGDYFDQGGTANTPVSVDIYFEPITYTIAYDFNGYDQSDITFSALPLQSTYTVYDMIKVPYDAGTVSSQTYVDDGGFFNDYSSHCRVPILGWLWHGDAIGTIRCVQDVPGASVAGNTLLGWNDQNGASHTYANSGTNTSWSTDLELTANSNSVYSTFAARTSGNLVLTANWQNPVPTNNTNSMPNNSFNVPLEPQSIDADSGEMNNNDSDEDGALEEDGDDEATTE